MGKKFVTSVIGATAAFTFLGMGSALAHPGHEIVNGMGAGFLHPILGIDHLAVMALVGVWGGMLDGKARYLLPLAFVVTLAAGSMLALGGFSIPMFEAAIMASVIILGLLVAMNVKIKTGLAMLAVSVFAIAHGFAHGVEMPHEMSAWSYGVGFVAASAVLHVAGIAFGRIGAALNEKAVRIVGALTATAGMLSFAL